MVEPTKEKFAIKSNIDLGDLGAHECTIVGIPYQKQPDGTYAVDKFQVLAFIPWTEGQPDITDYLTDQSHEVLQYELLRKWSEVQEQKRKSGEQS